MKAVLRGAGLGFVAGAAWGILARTWMRLITTEPEFTWGGTLAIIGFAALLGVGVGVAHAGRSRWWRLAVVPGLILFLSPGMLLLPAFALGGLAWSGRDRALQVVGALALVGSLGLAIWTEGHADAVLVVGFAALAVSLAWAGSLVWRQQSRAARSAPMVVSSP
ncbi:MAG: hypothetical protein ABIO16_05160 [Nocardioides sp.]